MAGIWKKMRSENGESLTELLLSVLIVSLGLSMFATALLSSKKMLELGEAKVNSYYTGRNALEQEQESNQKRLHDLTMMQSRADAQESEVRTFIKEIRRYAAIRELDEAVLNRLISRILIGEVKKVDGQKVQEVRIVYNFVGEIPAATE